MQSKNTLFFSASAVVILASLTGCWDDDKTPSKDIEKKFATAQECEAYFGHPCVTEVQPNRLTAQNTPLFTTRAACEAQFGLDNCLSTTVRSGRNRSATAAEDKDIDLSDGNWNQRIEDAQTTPTLLADDTVLYYPFRRPREAGSSYFFLGRGYYGGGPHFTYFPIIIGNLYTPPYVVGNYGRSAMGVRQSPSAGASVSTVGSGSARVGGIGGAPSSGGISSGATGHAGGFGASGGAAS